MKQNTSQPDFLKNGGKLGELIAKKKWDNTPFGPIELWPQSLKSTLSICLYSKFPIAIYWGEDMRLLFNDAWSPLLGERYVSALGQPAEKVWGDMWELIEPSLGSVLHSGHSALFKHELLPMNRRGFIEESYFDYTISPIFGEDQQIVGIINVGHEVTGQILHERRDRILRKLSEKSITAESPDAACILVANTLSEAPADIPFSLIYLINNDCDALRLAGSTSLDTDTSLARSTIDLKADNYILPVNEVIKTKKPQLVEGLSKHFDLPGGIWEEPTDSAVIVPIIRPQTKELYGIFVGGISPRLLYNNFYSSYFQQISELTAFSIGTAYDLRRKLALEARESEAQQQLQTALSTGSIGIWLWDIPRNVVIADRNLAYRFGIDYDAAQAGLPISVFTDSIHPDDRQRVINEIDHALVVTKVFESEYRTITGEGEIKWVMARGRVNDDAEGTPIRLPGVIVDITDRKEVEHELASSERMFSALFGSSIIGVIVATLDGKIHEANDTFLDMFGFTKKELDHGLYSYMITPSKSRGVTSIIYQMLREKGEVEPTEREYINKAGTTIPVMVGAVMISGSADRFIMFMLDISEQRQLMAVNKAKDEFISIASHQLRTPATGVKQYLGMLIEGYAGKLTPKQNKMLHTAYQSNERQLTIVNDLLRVAQADADEIKLRFEKIDLGGLLQDVINEQSSKFAARKQQIVYTQSTKRSMAMLDKLHIRMVFDNIIDNAHKYTPENKTITISLSAKRSSLVVAVKDQGVGIYKRDMSKLFKKFSRIENPLSTTAGGTGLGLYWVQKIIDLHNGTINVSSQHRHGTEFVITLPTSIKNT